MFRWAVWEMAKVAKQALEEAGISSDDLDAFIPHQANMRIIDAMVKQLKLPESRHGRPRHRDDRQHLLRVHPAGHASGCSRGRPKQRRHRALQIGFGAGLVFGAQVVILP